MKAILGVDHSGTYVRAAKLLLRLQLANLEVEALSVVEPLLPDMSWPALSENHPLTQSFRALEESSDADLAQAETRLTAAGATVTKRREMGNPAPILELRAEMGGADIIAVGSERKGRFGSLFMGSVTKGLCIGAKTNVLIGKKDVHEEGKLTAVFATDLSEYAYRCVDELLHLQPLGFAKITIVTAYGIDEGLRANLLPDDPTMEEFMPEAFHHRMETAARKIAERFSALADEVDVIVVEDEGNHAIGDAMKSTGADLLIMGAQGKNFLQRLTLGSTALHEVVNGDNNLLLLKPDARS